MLSLRARSAAAAAGAAPQKLFKEVLSDQYDATTNPQGFVNLGIAENTLMHAELVAHLKRHFDPPSSAFSYGSGPGGSIRLRTALAEFFNHFFAPATPVKSEHINISNGVTAALERCAFEIGDPGDSFLLGRPYYGSYASDIGDRANVRTIPVSFGGINPLSIAAVDCYAEAMYNARADSQTSGAVRALLLCSPHNPLGQCYPRETLVELMRFCQREQIHLICDEIYALSSFENPTMSNTEGFTSALSVVSPDIIDPALVHVLWGLSKDVGANGLRIGCVVSQANQSLVEALDNHAAYSFPSAMLEYMACCILEDHQFLDAYVQENRRRLQRNYILTVDFLKTYNIPFHASTNAGMFVWINLGEAVRRFRARSPVRSVLSNCPQEAATNLKFIAGTQMGGRIDMTDEMIMKVLVARKVSVASGDAFGSENSGWFRVVFAQAEHVLFEGLTRMVMALGLDVHCDRQTRQGR